MRINAKAYKILIKILIAIVILVVVAVAAFLILQISGKNRLYDRTTSARPDLAALEIVETVEPDWVDPVGDTSDEDAYVWQEGDVRFDGTIYRYNEDVLTFLFMGIDKKTVVKKVEEGIDGGQSDALFLLVLNPDTKEANVIGIPRDTMAEIDVYDKDGEPLGTDVRQICLQHGYGDGAEVSCERSVNAVSKLFYNLPIHGYCAINMGAIPLINDAIGGVEVTALEDVIHSDIKKGDVIHLMGEDAYDYIHNRDIMQDFTAVGRLERQKQYLTAYADKAIEKMKTDITLPVTLYKTLSKYMVTNITVDEVSYLATQVAGYRFSGENITSLEGEVNPDGKYEEFYPDEDALYELILNVFYEEVN